LICTGHFEARGYSSSFGEKSSHSAREELKESRIVSEICSRKIKLRQCFGLRVARSPNTFWSNITIQF
jgi:hypothetical protein